MKNIALLTDFGLDDYFVGVMKGVIRSVSPHATVTDITHSIRAHDVFEGALVLKSAYKYFPRGTVFLVVIDPGVGTGRKGIVVKTTRYVFVAPDNGILSLALEGEDILEIREIRNRRYLLKPVSRTFHGRDIFAPVAAHISRGAKLSGIGPPLSGVKKVAFKKPLARRGSLEGEIIYIDRFGNLMSNISKEDLTKHTGPSRNFLVRFKNASLRRLSDSYSERRRGSPLAIVGSAGYLEIAVSRGSAEKYFRARRGDRVEVLARMWSPPT
jgi:hypothetical protein